MKIIIFGSSVSSSWGNGHATLWRGLCRALGEQGHRVVFFEKDSPCYRAHRDIEQLPGGGKLSFYREFSEARADITRELNGADVAIVTSYCPDAQPAMAAMFDARVASRIFYDLDAPVTLRRLDLGERVEYLPAHGLGDFDLVLSYTGGRALEALTTRLGARRVAALYASVDPAMYRPVAPIEKYAADLSLLGTWSQDRHDTLLKLFAEVAARNPGNVFTLGGSLFPADFPRENIRHFEHVAPVEHPTFYASSLFTLNVTRGPLAEMGYCPSSRLFEAAACGVPVISDSWQGIDTFYEPGKEILIARSGGQVQDYLKMSPLDIAHLGQAARERTLSQHTASARAAELVRLIENATTSVASRTAAE
jgi:spore maturation protein CgeB